MPQKLGQHFLTNASALRNIAAALEIEPGDTIVEIGPGHGELTQKILEAARGIPKVRLILIERDKDLAGAAKEFFTSIPIVKVMEGDALKLLPPLVKELRLTHAERYKITGNIPYYITGKLLRILAELTPPPSRVVLTIQREVALRLVAVPPKMNLLAAAVQFWAEARILLSLPPEAFTPPPQVTSAVILLTPQAVKPLASKNYYRFIRIAFKQPRKTLLNNLRAGDVFPRTKALKAIMEANLSLESRPQDLTLAKIKELARRLLP